MKANDEDEFEGKPPFFNTWRGMYFFVLINLVMTILIFWLITIYFK